MAGIGNILDVDSFDQNVRKLVYAPAAIRVGAPYAKTHAIITHERVHCIGSPKQP